MRLPETFPPYPLMRTPFPQFTMMLPEIVALMARSGTASGSAPVTIGSSASSATWKPATNAPST